MVKIISDSTCDLSQELLRKYEIDILPLHILLGDKEYEDGKNITPDQIYAWSDANKTTPKTSAPALADAMELFRPYAEAGREIVCFSISAGMSTSGNVMRLAAEELGASDRIKVIDSANLSTGIGLLVVEAAIMAKNNRTASQIVSEIEKLKPNVRASFVVDTLTYLYRGGRCNAVAAMAGGVLKLSTSGNVMRLAAEELGASDRIKVIDSANLSTGIGLLVVEAAIMAKNNRTASQIVSEIERLKPNVRASFVVDTLTYLYRGGRCNAVAAMAGGILKLHPRIVVENGAMNASKKYRGKINSVIMD